MSRTLAAAALAFTLPLLGAASAEAMSCQNRLVIQGDAPARVRSLCGEPTEVTERVVQRTRAVSVPGPRGVYVTDYITVSVVLVQWIYDFGPTRFMRALTFENGRLLQIETLGYGTASPRK